METLEKVLTELGLTLTETRIYLEGIRHASQGAAELARATRIKRPTVYHAIATLMDKGLVAEKKVGGKLQFIMAPLEQTKKLAQRERDTLTKKESELERLIPMFANQLTASGNKPFEVVQYQGIDGVKTVYDIALYAKRPHWDVIAPIDNFLRGAGKEYAEYYLRSRKQHHIVSRTLWETKQRDKKLSKDELRERNPRLMPQSMQGKFTSMIILFDDKVAIIGPWERKTAMLIVSEEVSQMFQAMFEAIWNVSQEYNPEQ